MHRTIPRRLATSNKTTVKMPLLHNPHGRPACYGGGLHRVPVTPVGSPGSGPESGALRAPPRSSKSDGNWAARARGLAHPFARNAPVCRAGCLEE